MAAQHRSTRASKRQARGWEIQVIATAAKWQAVTGDEEAHFLKGCGHSTSVGAFFPGPNQVNHRYLRTSARLSGVEDAQGHGVAGRAQEGHRREGRRGVYMANGIASGDHRKAGIRNQPHMPDMKLIM